PIWTRAGSASDASSTRNTPSEKSAARACPAASASRVFPVPGGPVSVTSRTSSRRSSPVSRWSSASRPTSGVVGVGRLADMGRILPRAGPGMKAQLSSAFAESFGARDVGRLLDRHRAPLAPCPVEGILPDVLPGACEVLLIELRLERRHRGSDLLAHPVSGREQLRRPLAAALQGSHAAKPLEDVRKAPPVVELVECVERFQ